MLLNLQRDRCQRGRRLGAMEKYIIKTVDGQALLNVGCGTRMHRDWNNVDFSTIGRLRQHIWFARILNRLKVLSDDRWNRLRSIDSGIIIRDLRKGIPFPEMRFDAVYHSHLLEHIDRDSAPKFMSECRRVLRNGGILRVVVPDLGALVEEYLLAANAFSEVDSVSIVRFESAVENIFEQMVREEAAGTRAQKPIVRFVEKIVRGSVSKSGELHRWMYDRHSMGMLLKKTGFSEVSLLTHNESGIPGWTAFGLDTEPDGNAYKPGSLYMEARK